MARAQLELALQRRRRRRRGVKLGRPPRGPRSSERHQVRPDFDPRHPGHVTCRIAHDLGGLRTRDMYRAIRAATVVAARRTDFRIAHLSIQHDHLHLIVEADDKHALARGMQGFAVSVAKQIHRALRQRTGVRRRGAVFTDRYNLHVLRSPTEVRRAIAYVVNNWRRHREDESPVAAEWCVDLFASAPSFDGWLEPQTYQPPPTYEPLVVARPQSWVLAVGWRRGGGAISMYEVPGKLAPR